MKNYRLIGRISALISITLLAVSTAVAAVVTVDIAGKKVESDAKTLEPRIVKIVGKQMSLQVRSNDPQPQQFTLKVNGLQSGDQDVYINGKFVAKMPDTALSSGYVLSIPGRCANPDQLRCIESLRDKVKAEIARLEKMDGSEPGRVLNTMRQADMWVLAATQSDKFMRAVDVIVAPSDLVLQVEGRSTVKAKEEVDKTFFMACKLLQQARSRMYNVIKDPVLRNASVIALTPVELKVSYFTINGKLKADAKVINNSNLPINGKVSIILPSGWKADAKNLSFTKLAAGKSYSVPFALVAPKTGGNPPQSISFRCDVKIGDEPLIAKLALGSPVSLGSSSVVPQLPVIKAEPDAKPAAAAGAADLGIAGSTKF